MLKLNSVDFKCPRLHATVTHPAHKHFFYLASKYIANEKKITIGGHKFKYN